jgi:hypothetical protein
MNEITASTYKSNTAENTTIKRILPLPHTTLRNLLHWVQSPMVDYNRIQAAPLLDRGIDSARTHGQVRHVACEDFNMGGAILRL